MRTRKSVLATAAVAKDVSGWIALALVLATLAVYCPVAGFQFVNLDDPAFITHNPRVQAGLTAEDFQWAWRSQVTGNWHPLTMLSLMLDCQLFGVKPWWPHVVNALLHAANVALLFGLLKRMTGALWRSAIVAAFFALHPLHVESVAWVSERKDVLSTFFWLLSLWAYARYAENLKSQKSNLSFYGWSLLFCGLGMLCKPMLLTLPLTLLLLDYWPLARKPSWRLAWEKLPFVAMSVALCAATFWAQRQGGGMISLGRLTFGVRLANALVSYARYIGMMFWPRHLAGIYLIRSEPWPWWVTGLAGLLLAGVSVLVLGQCRRRPYLAAGWFWYLGTLVPVIGLAQSGMQAMADRFTYVPMIGLFVMVVWAGCEWGRFARWAAAAALAVCAGLTMHQEFFWKDTESLFKRMVDVMPDNYLARLDLGDYYIQAGRTNEAISNLTAALKLNPDYTEAHNNLATILFGQKRYDEAIGHLRAGLRAYPQYISYFNLANALMAAGEARQDANALAEAVSNYQQALRLNPNSSEAHQNLGLAFQAQGHTDLALAQFEEAARLDCNRPATWNDLGLACANQNRMAEAEQAFRELVRLQPDDAEAWCSLGSALAAQNKLAEAVPCFQKSLKLNPGDFRTECNFAHTLLLQGKRDEAAEHYRQALRINPNCIEAQEGMRALQNQPALPHGGNR